MVPWLSGNEVLLNAPRDAVAVERSHRIQRPEDHQVQCPLQKVEFGIGHIAPVQMPHEYHMSLWRVHMCALNQSRGGLPIPRWPARSATRDEASRRQQIE